METYVYYDIIKKGYNNTQIPYEILLKTFEWRSFRETIINRDNTICTICNNGPTERVGNRYLRKPTIEEIEESSKPLVVDVFGDGSEIWKMKKAPIIGIPVNEPKFLHVHHTFYVLGKLPWEYEVNTLKTVCGECHLKIHESENIPVYFDNTFKELIPVTPCKRCKGTGFLNEYHHVQDGICFRCSGRKFEEFI